MPRFPTRAFTVVALPLTADVFEQAGAIAACSFFAIAFTRGLQLLVGE